MDVPDSPLFSKAKAFLHFTETNDFASFKEVVSDEVCWRRFRPLRGSAHTMHGPEKVYRACAQLHAEYQDLTYTINAFANEEGKLAMYWTAQGVNRAPLFGRPASYKPSVFSGITLFRTAADGRISEVVEFRQPTSEEMTAFFRPEVLAQRRHQHLSPCQEAFCLMQQPQGSEIAGGWRTRAVEAVTEWMESWTAAPDLERYVREDVQEFNSYSWPDFAADAVGREALLERYSRPAQEAVVIHDTIADSSSNLVAVHWSDWRPEVHSSSVVPGPSGAGAGPSGAPQQPGQAPHHAPLQSELPWSSMPHQQPAVDHVHGSVEMVGGHLRVNLPSRSSKDSLSSTDEGEGAGGLPGVTEGFRADHRLRANHVYKVSGVTLFQLDKDCKIAWLMTFRELNSEEKKKNVRKDASNITAVL